MSRVVVVGDVMLDVVTRPLGPIAPTSDTSAVVRVGRGGAGANLAVRLAAAGHDVTYVGVAGRDAAADVVRADLKAAGVRDRITQVEGHTGVVVSLVAPDGQRAMVTDRGVNPMLDIAHLTVVLAEGFDHLHVSGYTLLDAATRDAGAAGLARARETGRTTSVDVCSAEPLRRVGPNVFAAASRDASTLFANEEEATVLAHASDADEALAVLSGRYDEVVVTRGARGIVVARGTQRWSAPAAGGDVLDTTGAGDAATGAYLAARLDGGDVAVAMSSAMAAAADVVATLGSAGQSRL